MGIFSRNKSKKKQTNKKEKKGNKIEKEKEKEKEKGKQKEKEKEKGKQKEKENKIENSKKELIFFESICMGNREKVQRMIQKKPSLIYSITPEGYTSLMKAIIFEDIAMIQLLITSGVDPKTKTKGNSALIFACKIGNNEIINILLQLDRSIYETNQGESAFSICEKKGNPTISEFLSQQMFK